jgi:NAD binding domain of 6-phosphogluconate dehydrogenase
MGLPVCTALAGAGYQVTATDQRAESEADAVAYGVTWRDTPAQAATEAGVLITMLPGSGEMRAVMLGAAGALEAMAAGTTWIDMTSSSPAAARPAAALACTCQLRPLTPGELAAAGRPGQAGNRGPMPCQVSAFITRSLSSGMLLQSPARKPAAEINVVRTDPGCRATAGQSAGSARAEWPG